MNGVFVYLIGFGGCGKLTIARALQARWPCILVDNHFVNNVILSLIDPDGKTKIPLQVWENVKCVRSAVLATIRDFAKPARCFVFTNVLAEGDAESAMAYAEVADLARQRDALFLPVRLTIAPEELVRRVVSPGRAERFKAIDADAAFVRATSQEVFRPTGVPYLDMDVTELSPEQAADSIVAELRKRGARPSIAFRVRCLARQEWPLLRDLRLAALHDAPDQFGESRARALERSAQEWGDQTVSVTPRTASRTYIAEVDGNPVGVVFAIQDMADASTGRLGGLWVDPGSRGIGIGMALVEAVTAWAVVEGMQRVRLWVVPNTPGDRLYRRARFLPTGMQKPFPGDESRSVIELQLESLIR